MMSCNTEGIDISKHANQETISQPRMARRKFAVNSRPAPSPEDRPIAPLHVACLHRPWKAQDPAQSLRRIYCEARLFNREFMGGHYTLITQINVVLGKALGILRWHQRSCGARNEKTIIDSLG